MNLHYKSLLSASILMALTDEEITILQLRKNLEINTYEEIAKKLPIKLSVNSLKQKVYLLRAKLGADNIDTAIRIFEERYYKL